MTTITKDRVGWHIAKGQTWRRCVCGAWIRKGKRYWGTPKDPDTIRCFPCAVTTVREAWDDSHNGG